MYKIYYFYNLCQIKYKFLIKIMKSIYFITFLFLFSTIYSALDDKTKCTGSNYHLIDTGSRYYKPEIAFDWTSEDEYELNIPFTELKSESEITPFLVNATIVKKFKNLNDKEIMSNATDIFDDKFQNYLYAYKIADDKFIIHNNVLRANIKSTDLKANENDVGETFKYYFGWRECNASAETTYRVSEIYVNVNNGKLYQISKYLLFVIAGLLL